MYVCCCKGVTDHEIRELLESPFIVDVDDVGAACGAGTGCGSCRDEIRQLCEEARITRAAHTDAAPEPVSVVGIAEVAVRIDAERSDRRRHVGARAG